MRWLTPLALFLVSLGGGCAPASLRVWSSEPPDDEPSRRADRAWVEGPAARAARPDEAARASDGGSLAAPVGSASDDRIEGSDLGDGGPRAVVVGTVRAPREADGVLFRNTYYDFPREGPGVKAASIFDAACGEITKVTQDFHDRLCVQGSGRLEGGATVSFAKRDCACAAACPRTGQKICFERLSAARFPHGRGATGRAITPLRTVAVDTSVIPLGTAIYISEFAGVPRPNGTTHDGCFVAEDRGLKVTGRQVDVFTGDPAETARYNALVPSNQGVHVYMNDPRCRP